MLLTDMGSHISLKTLKEFWPLVALPIVMLSLTYVLGRISVRLFNQPSYIVPGMVFNNVVAMPLLLLEAISNSDVLLPLLREGETLEAALIRARAYVLLHGIVHNLARFALGPIMLKQSGPKQEEDVEHDGENRTNAIDAEPPTETTALLSSAGSVEQPNTKDSFLRERARLLSTASIDLDETDALLRGYREIEVKITAPDGSIQYQRRGTLSSLFHVDSTLSIAAIARARRQSSVFEEDDPLNPGSGAAEASSSATAALIEPEESEEPKLLPPPPPRWMKIALAVEQFLNPAVLSALLAVFIGVTPPLHYIFYKNVAIASSFTQSIKSIGGLYPALQLFALGSKLTAPLQQPVRKSTIILIAIVRFAFSGLISVSIVAFMTSHCSPSLWPMDPMLNFILMITPVGPPAITLAAVAEIAGVSSEEVTAVSRMLLYSYVIAPLVAPSVAVALSIAYDIK